MIDQISKLLEPNYYLGLMEMSEKLLKEGEIPSEWELEEIPLQFPQYVDELLQNGKDPKSYLKIAAGIILTAKAWQEDLESQRKI